MGRSAMKVLFLLLVLCSVVWAQETETANATAETGETANTTADAPKKQAPIDDGFDVANENWGSYYDPQGIFCGKFDCYKILGFDYESFGKKHPDKKVITKRYRALSREWHPDKSKHADAKNRFVKISRAYEVLTSEKVRKEYDYLRYNQEAYFQKYGTSVVWSYAAKSDLWSVVFMLFIISNIVSWFTQKHRWTMVADRLAKAATEDWTPLQGGTTESKQLREQALQILAADAEKEVTDETAEQAAAAAASKKQKGSKKVPAREKKRLEQEAMVPIIKALVNDMKDFGGGFHQPTWRDLLIVTLAKLPFKLAGGLAWNTKYFLRRLQKIELDQEEIEVLTRRAVGPISWETASDQDREVMIKRELWVISNLADWNEEQEVKKLPAAEQKMYWKLKKKEQKGKKLE
jgi:DnaJ family protein C protein 25